MFESLLRKKKAAIQIVPYPPAPTPLSGDDTRGDMWDKCPSCHTVLFMEDVVENLRVCARCGCHFRLSARQRLNMMLDEGSFEEYDAALTGGNPLEFAGYEEKLRSARDFTGISEAVITGRGAIEGLPAMVGAMEPGFMMGSMGAIVGEKLARLAERALDERLPLIIFTVSGGARMQEGLMSLMQMAKVSGALARLADARLPYFAVLTDPTTGGVTASFAMLGDVTLAEPGSLVGFAGRRVIEQTVKQTLPPNFQTAEFLSEKGFVDRIVPRRELRATLAALLRMHMRDAASGAEIAPPEASGVETMPAAQYEQPPTAWERVKAARDPARPTMLSYLPYLFDDFMELKGDRLYADDGAIVGGLATIAGVPVTVIGQEKGRDITDKVRRNFGCAHPEGYRKSLRLMEQAEKFGRPVVCIVDTQGAHCGVGAEERGIGAAIAENLSYMMRMTVPILALFIGEGGSGGALALAVANRCAMLENAVYSILSPEGFASILWKDGARAEEAAQVMRMTAEDVRALGVVEDVLPEPPGGAQADLEATAAVMRRWLTENLAALARLSPEARRGARYARFRAFGSGDNEKPAFE